MPHDQAADDYPAHPRRRFLLPLLAFGIGCVLAAVVGEAIVRLVEPRPDTHGISTHGSAREYGYAPNSNGFAGGVRFVTNSSGFRGPEFGNLDSAFVIVVLGDSYSFGYGVEYAEAFPALLEANLRRRHQGWNVRVIDLGIPGYNTSQELATLKEWAPRLHPNLVLLQYHLNDIQRQLSGAPASKRASGTGLERLKRHLHLLRFLLPRLAGAARALGLPVKTTATAELADYTGGSPAWQRNQATLQELFAIARSGGAAVGVLIVPYMVALDRSHPLIPAYDAVYRFCVSSGVPVVNSFRYFMGRRAGALWINAFDGHPNAAGHALLAAAAGELVAKADSNLHPPR